MVICDERMGQTHAVMMQIHVLLYTRRLSRLSVSVMLAQMLNFLHNYIHFSGRSASPCNSRVGIFYDQHLMACTPISKM